MCFMLYAGTDKPIPRREWKRESPDISVRELVGQELDIRAHFSKPEVQFIGSTSGCGCDFPKALLISGIWPDRGDADGEEESLSSDRKNCERLVEVLRKENGGALELYCVWAGEESEPPMMREAIALSSIAEPNFYFKERCFYTVFPQPVLAED